MNNLPLPSWTHQLKVEYDDYNYVEHGVVGNFDLALKTLIMRVKEKEPYNSTILAEFDSIRGNDWYTDTRLSIIGSHEDYTEEEK